MNDSKYLSIITTVFFISLLSLFYLLDDETLIIYSVSVAISVIIFPILSTSIGFLFLLIQVLGLGFYNTFVAFYSHSTNINQFSVILEYFLLVVCLASLWFTFHSLKILRSEQER